MIPKPKKNLCKPKKIFWFLIRQQNLNSFAAKPECTVRKLFMVCPTGCSVCCCRNIAVFDYVVLSQALLGLPSYIGYVNLTILLLSKIF